MLQFTKDNTFTLTTTNGFSIPDGSTINGFVRLSKTTVSHWYFQVDWFLGTYADYPPSAEFLKFKELPSDFNVALFDGNTPIYTIPDSAQTGYSKIIDMASYPLQQYMIADPDNKIGFDLTGKLNIVFS